MASQEIFIVVRIVVHVIKWTEALCFMDGSFVVILDKCKHCHSPTYKSIIKPLVLLYFVFQFYINLRLAAIVSHFYKI